MSHWQKQEREKAVAAGDWGRVAYWDAIDKAQNQVCAQMNIDYQSINWEDPKNANLLQVVSEQAQVLAASPSFQSSYLEKLTTIDTATLVAAGVIGTAVVIAGVAVYNYNGVLVKAAGTGTITGTVWDKITPTASNLPGTATPATFQLRTAQRVLHVNSNATKHMAENINKFGAEGSGTAEIRSQAMLSSFNSAVQQGMANLATSAPGRHFINVGGWELGINTVTG